MPHYLIRGSYVAETWAALIKNPQNRREAVRPLIEGLGGKLDAFYFAFGQDDFVAIAELPDNVTTAAIAIATSSTGAFKSFSTTVLMTAEEAMDAMRKAGGIAYRPPT